MPAHKTSSPRRHAHTAVLPAFALAALLPLAGRGAEPWPQWRGPDGQGHAPDAHDLALEWSEEKNVAWKTPIPGRGWSSPVVADGLVWLTTALESEPSPEEKARRATAAGGQPLTISGPVSLRVVAVDLDTGRLRHDIEVGLVTDAQPIHTLNSFASPSPVVADGKLWCHFGDFGTACVETNTGRVVWAHRLLRLNHENGPGSTPVLWRDKLIIHLDGSDTQSIVALDAASGAIAWRTPRSGAMNADPQLKKAYGTPLVLSLGGRDVVLSPAADWLYAYDPADGTELWRMAYGGLGFSIVPRPVSGHGLLFMSTSFMATEVLAVRLADATTPPTIAWREKRGAPTMPSPLLVGDELYLVTDKGVATCLDARSGTQHWSERLGGNVTSSPLFAAGRIFVANRDGDTFVIRPGRQYGILATNHLDGAIHASPVAVGRALLLRTDKALYRIEEATAAADR